MKITEQFAPPFTYDPEDGSIRESNGHYLLKNVPETIGPMIALALTKEAEKERSGERKPLIEVIQKYLRSVPGEHDCMNWNEMQHKMADEILFSLSGNKKPEEQDSAADHFKALWQQGCEIITELERQNKGLQDLIPLCAPDEKKQEGPDIEKLIDSIHINKANFDYIGSTGRINGTLRQELYRIITRVLQPVPEKKQEGEREPTEEQIAEFIKGAFQMLVGYGKFNMMDYIFNSEYRIKNINPLPDKSGGEQQREEQWIPINERLPAAGQKVDLWIVPDDEEKSRRMQWTWERESTAGITISGCKVTHWMPRPEKPVSASVEKPEHQFHVFQEANDGLCSECRMTRFSGLHKD